MRRKTSIPLLCGILTLFPLVGCIEQIEPETISEIESLLVIDATITDELRQQKIVLSRAFKLGNDNPGAEGGADVRVIDDMGNVSPFQETALGTYVSIESFAARPNREYTLLVTTANGRTYSSKSARLPSPTQIDSLYAERITDDLDTNGMAIYVDNSTSGAGPNFYRYEYEETYKIIAPRWNEMDYKIVRDGFGQEQVIIAPRTREERLCYGTEISKKIILADTDSFDRPNIERFLLRFMASNNYILSYRYSILVKQFVLSPETYLYYTTLKDLSSSESLFSQNQPGFFNGNIISDTDNEERVLGHFEVSSVTEKRIFFNYVDFYPNEHLPPYFTTCNPIKPETLLELVRQDSIRYNDPSSRGEDLALTGIKRVCGDCTVLGSNVQPDFWVE